MFHRFDRRSTRVHGPIRIRFTRRTFVRAERADRCRSLPRVTTPDAPDSTAERVHRGAPGSRPVAAPRGNDEPDRLPAARRAAGSGFDRHRAARRGSTPEPHRVVRSPATSLGTFPNRD